MWIKRFRLKSYYSFQDTEWIQLQPGFNIFAGVNNSGKTALLKSFSDSFKNCPHKNKNIYLPGQMHNSEMYVDLEVKLSDIITHHASTSVETRFPSLTNINQESRINDILSNPENILVLEAFRGGSSSFEPREGASLAEFRGPGYQTSLNIRPHGKGWVVASNALSVDNLLSILNDPQNPAIFYLDPKRMHVGKTAYRDERRLSSDCSNLPNVILYLQSRKPKVYEQIRAHVSEITQSVFSFRAAPFGSDIEIIAWSNEDDNTSDAAFSLDESGTGIGQIISIITAAATNDQCIIVIDEISNFLHPAATKRLISILNSHYRQHQYIISTHSPEVISSVGSGSLHLIRRKEFASSVNNLSVRDMAHVREVSSELGFSMMDVFGHDRLVWVEGETELIAFPFLLRLSGASTPDGIGFVPVASASEFDAGRRSVKSIVGIYEHVVRAAAPLLSGMAFGVDREGNSDDVVTKIQRSKTKLRFLPRRCLECYLLCPDAIAKAILEADGQAVNPVDVEEFLMENGGDQRYKAKSAWKSDLKDSDWLKKVDAATLLHDCFLKLTDTRTEFRKTRDSIAIMEHIMNDDPRELEELTKFVQSLVDISKRDTRAR